MNNGLSERDLLTIHQILKQHNTIVLVKLFGSRAKGNYKTGSDIDLAIMNDDFDENDLTILTGDFEESDLPYFVDIVIYNQITAPKLKEHIDRIGIEFYKKNTVIKQ